MKNKFFEFAKDHTPPAPVLVVVLFLSAILVVAASLCVPATSALSHVTSDQDTHMGNKPDMAVVATRAIKQTQEVSLRLVDLLNDQLRAAETREADAWAALAEAQAEIERLNADVARPHISFATYGGQYVPKCCEGYPPGGCFCL